LAYRIRRELKNCSVFWMSARNMESLYQAYAHIARRLDLPGWDDEKMDVKNLVQLHLSKESAGQWLLVFDNADEVNLNSVGSTKAANLIEYLPSSKQGAIVFTTRDKTTAAILGSQYIVQLPEMEQDMAQRMLEMYLVYPKIEQEKANLLLEELAYFPIAIVQAASYINVNKISIQGYLSLLSEKKKEAVEAISKDSESVIAMTWLISFEQICRYDTLAADYLLFMACVDRNDVPLALLPVALPRGKGSSAVETLNAYSFVTKRTAESALDLHQLVHTSTRSWLERTRLISQWTQKVTARLLQVIQGGSLESRSKWRRLLPHAKYALSSSLPGQENEVWTDLVQICAMALLSDGWFDDAGVYFQDAVQRLSSVHGYEHPDTLTSMGNLALTFWKQGRWKEAEELEVQVLETKKRVLGEEHPSTLTSMDNLAMTYSNQERWKEAEELGVQARETRKRVLGEEHPDTLTSMGNLAITYSRQGRWKEAEELEVQVLETKKRVLGEEHPHTLTSMDNLAMTYSDQGRWKEAEELGVQVTETRKRVLGEEHPDTLTSMGNLALTFWELGRWKEAEQLEVQVTETRKRVLGEEHPGTLTSMGNLAITYSSQGRWKEAEELGVQVTETEKRVLGEEHPSSLTSIGNLAMTYSRQGRWKEAEELEVQVLETKKRVLGEEHPGTLTSMNNLAATYSKQERWKEAEELGVQVTETRKRVLGEEHTNTLTSMGNLALTFRELGRWKEAEELEVQVRETRKKALKE
jgi:tetratricopeptide (TPR) repeat protein